MTARFTRLFYSWMVCLGVFVPQQGQALLDLDIEAALRKALTQKRKKSAGKKQDTRKKAHWKRFSNPLPIGGRRGVDPKSQVKIAELLWWHHLANSAS